MWGVRTREFRLLGSWSRHRRIHAGSGRGHAGEAGPGEALYWVVEEDEVLELDGLAGLLLDLRDVIKGMVPDTLELHGDGG